MNKNVVILFHPAIQNQYYKCIPYAVLYLERMIRDLDVEIIIIDENVEKNYEPIIERVKDRILFAGISSIIGSQILGGIRFARYRKSLNVEKNITVSIKNIPDNCHPNLRWLLPLAIDPSIYPSMYNQILIKI